MSATQPPNDIILYTYAFSPFGKRVAAYLALRGVGYGLCVGRSVYCLRVVRVRLMRLACRNNPSRCRVRAWRCFQYSMAASPYSPLARMFSSHAADSACA